MLTDAEYQTYVTGFPEGIVYAVENPDTGDKFDFAAQIDGRLLFTVASLYDAVQADGSLLEATARLYLGLAAVQLKAAGAAPIQWVCQRAGDADALRALLRQFEPELRDVSPMGGIEVVVAPVEESQD